jgi:hypothetical protein
MLIWLSLYTALCRAQTSFAEDVAAYDFLSLLFAMAAGLLGGAARTILTLASEKQLVGNVKMVLLKDLVVALFGGGMAYLLIQGFNSVAHSLTVVALPTITRDLRVLLVVGAGFSRGRWMGVVDKLATGAIVKAQKRLGIEGTEFAASQAAPLTEK